MSDSAPDFVSDQHLLKQIIDLALDKKAIELVAMDVRGLSSVTDFFVICSGDSEPQVKAIADNIRRGTPHKPRHLEGYENLNYHTFFFYRTGVITLLVLRSAPKI